MKSEESVFLKVAKVFVVEKAFRLQHEIIIDFGGYSNLEIIFSLKLFVHHGVSMDKDCNVHSYKASVLHYSKKKLLQEKLTAFQPADDKRK